MNKILFPTDFSDAANNAFVYALRLANRLNSEIVALHVYDVPTIKGSGLSHTLEKFYSNLEMDEFVDFKDNLPKLRSIAEEQGLQHVPITSILKKSKHVDRDIIRVADEEEASFIVMGTKGATGLRELFVGSVAGEVMENANVPVLSVPEEAVFDGSINRIAIALDFTSDNTEAVMRFMEFANVFNAHIDCVHVDTAHIQSMSHHMDRMRESFSNYTNIKFHVLDGTSIRHALSEFMDQHDIDIMGMLTHKRSFFEELFDYSLTKKLSYSMETPILSIQAHTL